MKAQKTRRASRHRQIRKSGPIVTQHAPHIFFEKGKTEEDRIAGKWRIWWPATWGCAQVRPFRLGRGTSNKFVSCHGLSGHVSTWARVWSCPSHELAAREWVTIIDGGNVWNGKEMINFLRSLLPNTQRLGRYTAVFGGSDMKYRTCTSSVTPLTNRRWESPLLEYYSLPFLASHHPSGMASYKMKMWLPLNAAHYRAIVFLTGSLVSSRDAEGRRQTTYNYCNILTILIPRVIVSHTYVLHFQTAIPVKIKKKKNLSSASRSNLL